MMKHFPPLILLALGWFSNPANAAGILVYKNQPSHSDSLAHAFRYDKIEDQGFVQWVIVGNSRLRFEATQFHLWADLPDKLPDQIITDAEKHWVSVHLTEILGISKKYQEATPITKNCLNLLQDAHVKLADGMIRSKGEWMTATAYDAILLKERVEETRKQQAIEAENLKLEAKKSAEREKDKELQKQTAKKEDAERERKRMSLIAKFESGILSKQTRLTELENANTKLGRKLTSLAEQKYE